MANESLKRVLLSIKAEAKKLKAKELADRLAPKKADEPAEELLADAEKEGDAGEDSTALELTETEPAAEDDAAPEEDDAALIARVLKQLAK